MRLLEATLLSGLAFGLANAKPIEEGVFGRSLGAACSAPEGSGTCKDAGECKGISYSNQFCPGDDEDVQVHISASSSGII